MINFNDLALFLYSFFNWTNKNTEAVVIMYRDVKLSKGFIQREKLLIPLMDDL